MIKQYSFLSENNQTISRYVHNARQFGRKYWKSGKRDADRQNGICHVYRTTKDEDGNIKIKRIKKDYKEPEKKKVKKSDKK